MTARVWMVLAAAAFTAACGQGTEPQQSLSKGEAAEESGFLDPPRVSGARRLRNGGVVLSGQGRPLARLRLATPEGRAFNAVADESGAWTIELPQQPQPALFGLSGEVGDRRVQAEGYIAVLPAPGPAAALLRAGAGALPIASTPAHTTIKAVDMDAGAAILTGTAPPSAQLSAFVDGAAAGQVQSSSAGTYQLSLSDALAGPRQLTVRGPDRQAKVDVPAGAPRAPQSGAFAAARFDEGWRIDWMTPGGGVQTTLIFASESSPAETGE